MLRRPGTLSNSIVINDKSKLKTPRKIPFNPLLRRKGTRTDDTTIYTPNFGLQEEIKQDKHGAKIHFSDDTKLDLKTEREHEQKKGILLNSYSSGKLNKKEFDKLFGDINNLELEDILEHLTINQKEFIKNAQTDLKQTTGFDPVFDPIVKRDLNPIIKIKTDLVDYRTKLEKTIIKHRAEAGDTTKIQKNRTLESLVKEIDSLPSPLLNY